MNNNIVKSGDWVRKKGSPGDLENPKSHAPLYKTDLCWGKGDKKQGPQN